MSGWGQFLETQEAQRNLCAALRDMGATIYGWHEDQSDSMTDYYHPASWDGVATYGGCVICVATTSLDVRSDSGMKGWPEFHVVAKGYSWHIERNGEIVAQGKGLNKCAGKAHRRASSMAERDRLIAQASRDLAAKILRICDKLNGVINAPMIGGKKPELTEMEPGLSRLRTEMLRPCPFCGNKDRYVGDPIKTNKGVKIADTVYCRECDKGSMIWLPELDDPVAI